jgi:protein transport protein SEC61 subunit gamma and related proteins
LNFKEIISRFIADSKRIFIVSRKPTKDEYKKMAIIIGIGIIIIGIVGFLVYLIFNLAGLVGA